MSNDTNKRSLAMRLAMQFTYINGILSCTDLSQHDRAGIARMSTGLLDEVMELESRASGQPIMRPIPPISAPVDERKSIPLHTLLSRQGDTLAAYNAASAALELAKAASVYANYMRGPSTSPNPNNVIDTFYAAVRKYDDAFAERRQISAKSTGLPLPVANAAKGG